MASRKLTWKKDTQFAYEDEDFGSPSLSNVEVVGSGDDAYIALESYSSDDDITYDDAADYTPSNPDKIEVDAANNNKAALKVLTGGNKTWPFTTNTNYLYDSDVIEFVGGVAKFKKYIEDSAVELHCKLNELTGLIALDSSGNGRDGTLINMGDENHVTCLLNNGLSFDGTEEHVEFGNVLNFSKDDSFSLECWIKTSATQVGLGAIIAKQGFADAKTGYCIGMLADGSLTIILANSIPEDNRIQVTSTTDGLDDGEWHHLVMTYNGNSAASGIKLYIDGIEDTLIVVYDNLTAEITSNYEFHLGSRDGTGNYYEGFIDEVVVYDRVITEEEVVLRYNEGDGVEGFYFYGASDIVPVSGFDFITPMTVFTETATKPSGTGIKYQVTEDGGTVWKWWNGSAWIERTGAQTDLWYYTNESNTESEVAAHISGLIEDGVFKFRAFLGGDSLDTPEIDEIYVEVPSTFSTTDNLYVDTKDTSQLSFSAMFSWLSILFTYDQPANTDIKVLFSVDGRSSWLTWGGSSWQAPFSSTVRSYATSISDAIANFSSLPVGSKKLDVRLFLRTTDNSVTPEVDNINVVPNMGYKTSGSYTSICYFPKKTVTGGMFLDTLEFSIDTPEGTSIMISLRGTAPEFLIEEDYQSYEDGDSINLCADSVIWKADFSSTGELTPKLNELTITFHILIGIMRIIEENSLFIKDIEGGDLEIAKNQLTYYKDDHMTEVARFDLFDESGNPSMKNVFRRKRV